MAQLRPVGVVAHQVVIEIAHQTRQVIQHPDGGVIAALHVSEGQRVAARRGDTVTAALLASGLETTRETAVSGAKRGPYCMMGVCFDCLVTINGVGNRQGCLVPVEDVMYFNAGQKYVTMRHRGGRELIDESGGRHGPYDLVIAADGAASTMPAARSTRWTPPPSNAPPAAMCCIQGAEANVAKRGGAEQDYEAQHHAVSRMHFST